MTLKNKKLILGIVIAFFIFLVFMLSILKSYRNFSGTPEKDTPIQGSVHTSDANIKDLPEIDWGEMSFYFHISNVRMETKVADVELLGSVLTDNTVSCDIVAIRSLTHPFFLARFFDSKNEDILKSKPIHMEFKKKNEFTKNLEPGIQGKAYFFVDKEKLKKVTKIKIVKRI